MFALVAGRFEVPVDRRCAHPRSSAISLPVANYLSRCPAASSSGSDWPGITTR